MTAQCSVQY